MKRVAWRPLFSFAAGLAVCLLAGQDAVASDIACHTPVGGASARCEEPYGSGLGCEPRSGARAGARKEHLICEYSMLSERYERIYAEQQRMLRKGSMQAADIAAWRARRDACDSVPCLDGVFHLFWRQRDAMRKSPARPALARQGTAESPGAASHEAVSRPLAPALATPSPGKTALHDTPAPAPRPAAVAPAAFAETRPEQHLPDAKASALPVFLPTPQLRVKPGPTPLLVDSLVSGLAVLGVGAGLVWNRRRRAPQMAGKAKRRRIPPVMMIAYGLLIANALLLPFTLGLR